METRIYCSTKIIDDQTGVGIIINLIDDQGQQHIRKFGWGLSLSSLELSKIQVIRLALCSITPKFRRHKTILYAKKYNSIKWKKELESLEQWINFYPKLEILEPDDSEYFKQAKLLAEKAAKTQKNYDSGTI